MNPFVSPVEPDTAGSRAQHGHQAGMEEAARREDLSQETGKGGAEPGQKGRLRPYYLMASSQASCV